MAIKPNDELLNLKVCYIKLHVLINKTESNEKFKVSKSALKCNGNILKCYLSLAFRKYVKKSIIISVAKSFKSVKTAEFSCFRKILIDLYVN